MSLEKCAHCCSSAHCWSFALCTDEALIAPYSCPQWVMVDIKLVRRLRRCIGLAELKAQPALEGMQLLTRPRLSVQQVSAAHWEHTLSLEDVQGGDDCEAPPGKKAKRGRKAELNSTDS